MKPDPRFLNQPKDFWADVRLLSQVAGYTESATGYWKVPTGLIVPAAFKKHGGPRKNTVRAIDPQVMQEAYKKLEIKTKHLVSDASQPTARGQLLCAYFRYRADVLNTQVEGRLNDAAGARKLYRACKVKYKPTTKPVMNKQKGEKRSEAYLTCIVNMIVEKIAHEFGCELDPQRLTTITRDGSPLRTFSRRLDGAFPSSIDPVAVWENKEYYYTTTFGSRILCGWRICDKQASVTTRSHPSSAA